MSTLPRFTDMPLYTVLVVGKQVLYGQDKAQNSLPPHNKHGTSFNTRMSHFMLDLTGGKYEERKSLFEVLCDLSLNQDDAGLTDTHHRVSSLSLVTSHTHI